MYDDTIDQDEEPCTRPASILAVGNPRAKWSGASTPFCKVSSARAGLCQLQSSASTSRRLALFVAMISLLSEALSAMNAPNSTPDQRGNADGVEAMAGPQMKARSIQSANHISREMRILNPHRP